MILRSFFFFFFKSSVQTKIKQDTLSSCRFDTYCIEALHERCLSWCPTDTSRIFELQNFVLVYTTKILLHFQILNCPVPTIKKTDFLGNSHADLRSTVEPMLVMPCEAVFYSISYDILVSMEQGARVSSQFFF